MMTHHSNVSSSLMRTRTCRLELANDVNIDIFEMACSLAYYMESLTNKPNSDIG